MRDRLAGKVIDVNKSAAIGVAFERAVEQRGVDGVHIARSPRSFSKTMQNLRPGVYIAGTVVAMHHGHGHAVRRRDHVDFFMHLFQLLFQHHHCKH